jgi:hypothetical protein
MRTKVRRRTGHRHDPREITDGVARELTVRILIRPSRRGLVGSPHQ